MKLTGSEIIAEYLIKEKVPYVVGIPGHGSVGLVDAFKDRKDKIEIIQVRHEQGAVHLADGYYRVSGRPLVVFTSIGPGAFNTAVGVATAYVDSMPVLVITGAVHTNMIGRGVLQEIERKHWGDFPRVLEPVVKRSWRVERVEQLPYVMHRAFNQMLTGRRGPVHIDLPMDVMANSAEVEIPNPDERTPKGRQVGDPEEIEKASSLLLKAKRPVILAGGGAVAAEAFREIKKLAEFLGAAVITTLMGKGAIREDHPLYGWHTGHTGTTCGNKLANNADVILAIGCRFEDQTTSSYVPGAAFSIPPTKLIHVDIDSTEIGKNYPVEIGVVGDAKAVLISLLSVLRKKATKRDYKKNIYFKQIQQLKDEWLRTLSIVQNSDAVPVTIPRVYKEIREFLDEDAIIVTSAGNPQVHMIQCYPFLQPKTNVTSGGFSAMGFTLPAAIGAKLAAPHRQVVGVDGDGSFLMTVQELATAVQYEIPVVIIVLNNIGWQSIRNLQIASYGVNRVHATEFRTKEGKYITPKFAEMAESFGAYGQRIERGEEIQPALGRAFDSGRPAIVEIMVNLEFKLSTPIATGGWWDMPVPDYLKEKRFEYLMEVKKEKLT